MCIYVDVIAIIDQQFQGHILDYYITVNITLINNGINWRFHKVQSGSRSSRGSSEDIKGRGTNAIHYMELYQF
jgi:hypothetical protein